MFKDIQRYVATCKKYQRIKARQIKPPGLLQSLEISEARWQALSMDFIVGLQKTI